MMTEYVVAMQKERERERSCDRKLIDLHVLSVLL